jgi:hypothetical protein
LVDPKDGKGKRRNLAYDMGIQLGMFNPNKIFHQASDGRTKTIAQVGEGLLPNMRMTIQTRSTFSFPHWLAGGAMMIENR